MIRHERAGARLAVAGGAALIVVALVALSAASPRHASVHASDDLDLTRPAAERVSRSAERSIPEPPQIDYQKAVEEELGRQYLQAVHEENLRVAAYLQAVQAEKVREAQEARAAAIAAAKAQKAAAATSGTPRGPVDAGSNRALGQDMAAARGWTGAQWECLDSLWGAHESSWSETADNPRSSAYGIPQATPGSKMASHGDDWRTNPRVQIAWGLDYIANRYGTPCSALAARKAKGWY